MSRRSEARRSGGFDLRQQEEGERGVALLEDAGAAEAVELFGELEFVVMLEDDEGVVGQEIGGGEKFEGAGVIDVGGVGRIDENEIEWRSGRSVARGEFLQGGERVGGEDSVAGGDFERVEVLADEFCGGRMIFDEGHVGGAAAERFDADGASAGEDVKEARANDTRAEDVEERFAKAVAGRAKREPLQALQDAAAIFAGDDSHVSEKLA